MKDEKEKKTVEEQKQIAVKEPINAEGGILTPSNFDAGFRLAKCYVASGLLPKLFNTPEKALVAMQLCYELGLQPLTGMRQIAVINGTPSLYGDLPLALVHRTGQLMEFKETFLDNEGKEVLTGGQVFAAKCYAKRKNGIEAVAVFSLDDAKKANLIDRSDSWKKYEKDMLIYRARSRVLKSLFPDALNGIAIAEYDYAMNEEEIKNQKVIAETGPINIRAEIMNEIQE